MDTTHDFAAAAADLPERLLGTLDDVDPADAPAVAEELAQVLAQHLDASGGHEGPS